jgi:hypothetical protein
VSTDISDPVERAKAIAHGQAFLEGVFTDPNALSHWGVLGMKWGVRKEEEFGKPRKLSKDEEELKRRMSKQVGSREAEMAIKYGPGSLSGKEKPAWSKKKKAIVAAGVGLGVVAAAIGAAYGVEAYGDFRKQESAEARQRVQKAQEDYLAEVERKQAERDALPGYENPFQPGKGEKLKSKEFAEFLDKYKDDSFNRALNIDADDFIANLSDKEINLPKGTIVKRVSSEKETDIREDGFYASYTDDDVNRYKAVLPMYWKQWGIQKEEGYVVNLRATEDIKAPSPKRSLDFFEQIIDSKVESAPDAFGLKSVSTVRRHLGIDQRATSREAAEENLVKFAQLWANRQDPATAKYFKMLQDLGFNAVVDLNDQNMLSEQPLRFLNGKMFELAGHDNLSKADIETARAAIKKFMHSAIVAIGRAFAHMRGGE